MYVQKLKEDKAKLQGKIQQFRNISSSLSKQYGISKAGQLIQKPHYWVNYWRKKTENPLFHSKSHGGARNFRFTQEELIQIWEILWNHCQKNPTSRLHE